MRGKERVMATLAGAAMMQLRMDPLVEIQKEIVRKREAGATHARSLRRAGTLSAVKAAGFLAAAVVLAFRRVLLNCWDQVNQEYVEPHFLASAAATGCLGVAVSLSALLVMQWREDLLTGDLVTVVGAPALSENSLSRVALTLEEGEFDEATRASASKGQWDIRLDGVSLNNFHDSGPSLVTSRSYERQIDLHRLYRTKETGKGAEGGLCFYTHLTVNADRFSVHTREEPRVVECTYNPETRASGLPVELKSVKIAMTPAAAVQVAGGGKVRKLWLDVHGAVVQSPPVGSTHPGGEDTGVDEQLSLQKPAAELVMEGMKPEHYITWMLCVVSAAAIALLERQRLFGLDVASETANYAHTAASARATGLNFFFVLTAPAQVLLTGLAMVTSAASAFYGINSWLYLSKGAQQ